MFSSMSNPLMFNQSSDMNHINNEFPLMSSFANVETNEDSTISNLISTPNQFTGGAPVANDYMNAGNSLFNYDATTTTTNVDQQVVPIQNEFQPIPINQNFNSNIVENDLSSQMFYDNEFGMVNNVNYYSTQPPMQHSAPLVSVNSFDMSSSQLSVSQYDMNYTPPSRNINIDYSQYFSQSLPQGSVGSLKKESPEIGVYEPQVNEFGKKRYRVIRGVSAGGCSTRPPKQSLDSDSVFLPVQLDINGAAVDEICYPKWSPSEKDDRRRIIRIERIQDGPKLTANFSIVGAANENPIPAPSNPNVDTVEVSCLECSVKPNDDYDSPSSDEEKDINSVPSYGRGEHGEAYQYYITSVEVVEIVELLIGTQLKDPAERRKERGRVRSNLVPFWSKKSISSRMDSNQNKSPVSSNPTNQDYRVELAKRIMGYEIRKPRGFDKDVRILRWDKLVPALKRALQSYYTEIPQADAHLEF